MHCTKCGKLIPTKIYPDVTCQGCYNYYHKGGTDNPTPPKGKITHDHRGYVVCHICGRAYKRLGSHVKEFHKMSIAEYKAEFELCNNTKTTEKNYSEHMHKFECNGSYHPDGEEMLWGHIQLCHPYIFERDKDLETPFMIEENYTLKEN